MLTKEMLRQIYIYRRSLITSLQDIIDDKENDLTPNSSIGELLTYLNNRQMTTQNRLDNEN